MLSYPQAPASLDYACMTDAIEVPALADQAHTASVNLICDKINDRFASMAQNWVQIGQHLIELQASCEHGEWGKIIDERLPFNRRTAQKLMAIANHPLLSNASRASHLPPSWSILAEIAALDTEQIEQAIDTGIIHPTMKRDDVRSLSHKLRGTTPKVQIAATAVAGPEPSVDDERHCKRVAYAIGALCGVPPSEILSATRHSAPSALARQLVCYVLCTMSGWTPARAALTLSRDRTTVEHGRDVIWNLRDEDDEVDQWVEGVCVIIVEAQKLADGTPVRMQDRGIAA